MIWGCICYDGDGTLTSVNGNINSEKYIEILVNNLWPVIALHLNFLVEIMCFKMTMPLFRDCCILSAYMEEIHINTTAQSPDINIIENIWLNLKRRLQSTTNTINSKDQMITEVTHI